MTTYQHGNNLEWYQERTILCNRHMEI